MVAQDFDDRYERCRAPGFAMKIFSLRRIVASLAVAMVGTHALAQSFPSKPVRLIVPFPAGGAVDTVARAVGQKLGGVWNQQVLVENRAGAGGNIGADAVAKSAPDGYTLLITTNGLAISPSLYKKLPFDPIKDFAPVTQLTASYLALAVNPQLGANTAKELVELARAKPGSISYGSTGVGVAPHLVMELFKAATGIDMLHVPYKGDAQVGPALVSGEVQAAFLPPSAIVGYVKAGRLLALAVTSAGRAAALPDVPSIVDAGFPSVEYAGWLGVLAPANTPRDTINQIQRNIATVLSQQEMKDRLPTWGYEPVGTTAAQFDARYKTDIAAFAKLIQDARIPMQE
ncbi:MAG: Bug family tripartite tricarboxylate transporter substrate binding protein [Burkholderiales bacterium]